MGEKVKRENAAKHDVSSQDFDPTEKENKTPRNLPVLRVGDFFFDKKGPIKP